MRPRLGCLLTAAAVTGAAALALALVEIDSPEIGRALLERAGRTTGATLEASEFRLSLLKGLSLRNVRASGRLTGGQYEASMERLVFAHRLLPLLTGRLAVDRILLERPQITVTQTGATAPRATPPGAVPEAGMAIALHIAEIDVDGGTVTMRIAQEPPTTVKGLHVRLRDLDLTRGAGPLAGLSAKGEVRVDEIDLTATRVREARGTFRLAAGRVESEDLRFRTDEGPFEARWTADLKRLPFSYTLVLLGAPLDLNTIAGMAGKGGRFGPARLKLDARGAGPEPEGAAGDGVLHLEAGTLPATPLLSGIEKALGRTRIVGAGYDASETPFRLDRGRVAFERLRLKAETVGFDVSGWSSVAGAIDMVVAVRAPRAQVRIAEVPTELLDALTDAEGWVSVPLRVTGTRLAPRVVPDLNALGAQARRGGAKVLERKAIDKLRGLFGGRD
jgi:hypothetical protein